jgi:hypothetical protein
MDLQSFIDGVADRLFYHSSSRDDTNLHGIRGNNNETHCVFFENPSKFTVLCRNDTNLILVRRFLEESYLNIPVNNWNIEYCEEIWAMQIPPGSPIGHINLIKSNSYGTFGGYVGNQNGIWGISNNHVIADNNNPTNQTEIKYSNGQLIGNLSFYQELLLPPSFNQMDVALFQPNQHFIPLPNQNWRLYEASQLYPGERVFKIGAKTGLTVGVISSIYAVEKVNFSGNLGILAFNDCLVIQGIDGSPFSLPGDSGSLVYRESDSKLIGIVFAGTKSDRGHLSFVNKSNIFFPHFGLTHFMPVHY